MSEALGVWLVEEARTVRAEGTVREAFGALDVSDVIWLVSLRSQYLLFGE